MRRHIIDVAYLCYDFRCIKITYKTTKLGSDYNVQHFTLSRQPFCRDVQQRYVHFNSLIHRSYHLLTISLTLRTSCFWFMLRRFRLQTVDSSTSALCCPVPPGFMFFDNFACLDELLEGAIQRRAQRLDVLVELNGGKGALVDAFRCEFEFLTVILA